MKTLHWHNKKDFSKTQGLPTVKQTGSSLLWHDYLQQITCPYKPHWLSRMLPAVPS